MRILYGGPEDVWGGFFTKLCAVMPEHSFQATGKFQIDTLAGFDVVIPTMSPVTKVLLESADRLRLVQQSGAGLEQVDIEAARQKNIQVCNVATDNSGNADSVAELGIYMMLGLSRNIEGMAKSLAQGIIGQPQGIALCGKTAGIIGLGGIGKALIKRLRAFDMRILGIKRTKMPHEQEQLALDWLGIQDDMAFLLKESDYVLLSLPLTAESKNLMNAMTLGQMKKGAFLINLSRGGIIEKEALEHALASEHLAGAGLDVFWQEPPDPADPLFRYNVLATPHVGGSTDISMKGILHGVVENIRRLEHGEPLLSLK